MTKNILILGGGITGLSAAYYLNKNDRSLKITIFEASPEFGGLAGGFKKDTWDWSIEHAYHHAFASDKDFLSLVNELNFADHVFFKQTKTSNLYGSLNNYRIFSVDSPLTLLRFSLLTFFERVRVGCALAIFKFLPYIKNIYEVYTVQKLGEALMGQKAYNLLFNTILRKKYGKYAENILSVFIWARVKTRTKSLGYVTGGYKSLTSKLTSVLKNGGVALCNNTKATSITKAGEQFLVNGNQTFDAVINTLPTALTATLCKDVLSKNEIESMQKINHLGAQVLVLETKNKILKDGTYWLSVCAQDLPALVLVQHTNYVDCKNFAGNQILYVGNYLDYDSEFFKMSKDAILSLFTPYLECLAGEPLQVVDSFLWNARDAQTVVDKTFLQNKFDFKTSVKNFYMANLDMTYPYDRGVNFAIKLGREVANICLDSN